MAVRNEIQRLHHRHAGQVNRPSGNVIVDPLEHCLLVEVAVPCVDGRALITQNHLKDGFLLGDVLIHVAGRHVSKKPRIGTHASKPYNLAFLVENAAVVRICLRYTGREIVGNHDDLAERFDVEHLFGPLAETHRRTAASLRRLDLNLRRYLRHLEGLRQIQIVLAAHLLGVARGDVDRFLRLLDAL